MLSKLSLKINIISLVFICLYSCSTSKNLDNKLLQGYWINLGGSYSNIILTEKDYILALDPLDTSSNIGFSYVLKNRKITLLSHTNWISKCDIIKLSTDTLIFKRRGDNQIFKFYRKRN